MGERRFEARQPAGQQRIVGKYGSDAHHNRIIFCAEKVPVTPRLHRSDPAAVPVRVSNPPVDSFCNLQRDEWTAFDHLLQESRIYGTRFGFEDTPRYFDPVPFQMRETGAGDTWIGIDSPGNNARYTGFRQCICAWRRLAVMGTGLQRDICRRAFGFGSGLPKRHRLGVRPAARLSPAAPHNAATGGNDKAAHGGVGRS